MVKNWQTLRIPKRPKGDHSSSKTCSHLFHVSECLLMWFLCVNCESLRLPDNITKIFLFFVCFCSVFDWDFCRRLSSIRQTSIVFCAVGLWGFRVKITPITNVSVSKGIQHHTVSKYNEFWESGKQRRQDEVDRGLERRFWEVWEAGARPNELRSTRLPFSANIKFFKSS